MTKTKLKESAGKTIFATMAAVCIVAVAAIFIFLIIKSFPAFKKIGFFDFLLGNQWSPDRLDTYGQSLSGTYGIFTMVIGTISATIGALLFGGVFRNRISPATSGKHCAKQRKRTSCNINYSWNNDSSDGGFTF